MFASAMGAEVTAISTSEKKKEDAMKMGATHYIATDREGWEIDNKRSLDFLISTASDSKTPIEKYLKLLRPGWAIRKIK